MAYVRLLKGIDRFVPVKVKLQYKDESFFLPNNNLTAGAQPEGPP